MKRSADQFEREINIQEYILNYLYKKNKNQQENILALQVDINNFILNRKLTECTLDIEVLAQHGSGWKLKAISQALAHNHQIENLTLKRLFTFSCNKVSNDFNTEQDKDIAQYFSSMLKVNEGVKHLTLYADYSNDNLYVQQIITQGIWYNTILRSLACGPDMEGRIPEYLGNHSSIKFLKMLDRIEEGVPEVINSSKIISLSLRIKEFEEFDCDDQKNSYFDQLRVSLQNNNNLQQLILEINNPDLDYADIIHFFNEVMRCNQTLENIVFEGECSDLELSNDTNNKLLANKDFNNSTIKLIYSLNFTINTTPTADNLEAIKRSKKMGNSLLEEKLKQHIQLDWNNIELIQRCGEKYKIDEFRNYKSAQDKRIFTIDQLNELDDVLREYISIYENNTESAVAVYQKIQELNNYYKYYSSYFNDEYKDMTHQLQTDLHGHNSTYQE